MTVPTEGGVRSRPESLGREDLATPHDLRAGPLAARLRPDARFAVLDVTKYFGASTGGIRTYLLEKARYVAAHPDLRHVMVVPGERDAVADAGGTRCYRVASPRIPTQRQYRALLRRGTLARIIAHERPDIVEIGSSILVPWLVRGAVGSGGPPTVWFFHTYLPGVIALRDDLPGRVLRWGIGRYVAAVARGTRATFAASTFAEDALRAMGAPRVVTVPLGVDTATFCPARREHADRIRRELDLPPGPFALYLGRIAREKCLEDVLAAWPEVHRVNGLAFVIVGDGPAQERLARSPGGNAVVWRSFVGDRERVAELTAAAAFVVAPGPFETFGLSALEGLASGTPVLAVDHGAAGELVTRSGVGSVYPRGDRAALAAAAIHLAGQDRGALGRRGRDYAVANHEWDRVMERLFTAYGEVLTP